MQLQTFYTVRFNDCDPFGHLNNARYIDYMINAREDHLRKFLQLDLADFYKQGVGWVVSSHEIQYIRPVSYNETVCIQSDLIQANDTDLLVEMRMYDENAANLKALLWSRFTCVNIKTGRRENNPSQLADIVKDLLVDVDVASGIKTRAAQLASRPVKMEQ